LTPSNKLNSSILNTTVNDKSPNRILPSKLKIISGPKPSQTQGERDKEAILDENQRLKVNVQRLKNEVAYHRAEFLKIETELKQKQKLIEDLLDINRKDSINSGAGLNMSLNFTSSPNSTNSGNKAKEYNLILNLKKNLKECQVQYKLKEDELTKLKKQIKLTKVNELLLENKTLNEEIKKIKDLYDTNLMSNLLTDKSSKELQLLQSTVTRQQNLVESLQNHNNKLLDESKKQSEKIHQYKEKCNKLRDELKERNTEIDSLKKILDDYEKLEKQSKYDELHKLINEREEKLKKKKEKSQNLKKELKEKISHIDELKKQCEEIPKMISTIEESKMKISKKKERSAKLKQELKIKQEELNKIINEFNEMHRVSVDLNKDNEQAKEFMVSYLQSRVTELTKESSYYKILSQKREKLLQEVKINFPNLNESDLQNYLKDQDKIVDLQTRLEVLGLQIEEKEKEIQQLKEKICHMENNIDVNVNIGHNDEHNQNGGDDLLGLENSGQMTEEQFSEMTYILIKNFEANNIDIKIAQEQMFNDEILGDAVNLTEKIADKIMEVLKNSNIANKEELIRYLKYFFAHYGINLETIREQFISVFENISVYTKETSEMMDQNLKSILLPYREEFFRQIKKRDPDNTGYITFFNLRKILEQLQIQLDTDSVEYFIYKLKCFEDSQSSFRDLKHDYITELLTTEGNLDDLRRGSKTSSVVMLPDKEYKAKSEAILAKIAAFLFSYEKNIKSVFNQTFTIQEKECKYNAMYLKLFLNVLQEEMKIPLDYMDSLCMFNRLKNSNNIFNIEVIDIDKLSEEMVYFGICETDKDETQRKQREAVEREYEFDYETEDLAKANANNYLHTDEREVAYVQKVQANNNKQLDEKSEEIILANNVLGHRNNLIEKDDIDNRNDEEILQRQIDKVTKVSKKSSAINSPKKEEALVRANNNDIIPDMNLEVKPETGIKLKNSTNTKKSNTLKQKVVADNTGYYSNISQQALTNSMTIENGDTSLTKKEQTHTQTKNVKDANGVISREPLTKPNEVICLENESEDAIHIGLLIEIKSYLRFYSVKFEKVFLNSDLHIIKIKDEIFVRLLPLLHFLNYKGIISTWDYSPDNFGKAINSNGLINLSKLKKAVKNLNFNQELEYSNKYKLITVEEESVDLNQIRLILEIKSYLRSNSLEFDKVFLNSDLHLVKRKTEIFVRLLPLIHFLNCKGIVSSWEYYPKNLVNVMDSEGFINLFKLKKAVENLKFNEDQELEFSKRYSKILINDLFVKAKDCKLKL
jgi:hypothetical protein